MTLDAQTILSILNSTTTLYVLDINNQSKTVTFQLIETVAGLVFKYIFTIQLEDFAFILGLVKLSVNA